jgi:hypothetical protein
VNVLAYLLVPILVVAVAASITWVRNRQPTSLQSGVDSFRREMDALSPDAAPLHRRRTDPSAPVTERPSSPPADRAASPPADRAANPPSDRGAGPPTGSPSGRTPGPPRRPPTSGRA